MSVGLSGRMPILPNSVCRHTFRLVSNSDNHSGPTDDALRECILLQLAGGDVVPAYLAFPPPGQDRGAGQLNAVVNDAERRTCLTSSVITVT